MKLEETPIVGELSLILSRAISNQGLAVAIRACDAGVASPVEYAFVAACFPFGAGMSIPKELLPTVRLVIESWKSHSLILSRQLFICFKIASLKDAEVIPEIFTSKVVSEIGIQRPLPKSWKIASGGFFRFFKTKVTRKKSGCGMTLLLRCAY
jgi:hypothetical protein